MKVGLVEMSVRGCKIHVVGEGVVQGEGVKDAEDAEIRVPTVLAMV